MIELNGIKKAYSSGGIITNVLKGIDLKINEGEFVSIMGPSGSGKSSLLNILGILDAFDHGSYVLSGKHISNLSGNEAAALRNRFIGFVFQSFNLLPYKNIVDNVALPLFYQGVARKERHHRAIELLNSVGLENRLNHFPSQLSGGQKQRVAIARALITNPKIILADEPTGALDSEASSQVMSLLRAINDTGRTIVLVTHDEEVAKQTKRLISFKDGNIQNDSILSSNL